jgi:MFS family permease
MELPELRRILTSKWLFLLSVGMFGVTGMSSLITAFMVYYLEVFLKVGVVLAGSVGALALLGSLIASPLLGLLYDRIRSTTGLMFICGLAGLVGLEFASAPNVAAAALANFIVGFATGGMVTVGFSAAREFAHAEYETLAVSCINSLQLFAGFIFPPLFSLSVLSLGYSAAWMFSGLFTFPFIAVLLLTKSKRIKAPLL